MCFTLEKKNILKSNAAIKETKEVVAKCFPSRSLGTQQRFTLFSFFKPKKTTKKSIFNFT